MGRIHDSAARFLFAWPETENLAGSRNPFFQRKAQLVSGLFHVDTVFFAFAGFPAYSIDAM